MIGRAILEASRHDGKTGDIVLATVVDVACGLGNGNGRCAFREGHGVAAIGVGPGRGGVEVDDRAMHLRNHRGVADGFEIAVHDITAAGDH